MMTSALTSTSGGHSAQDLERERRVVERDLVVDPDEHQAAADTKLMSWNK